MMNTPLLILLISFTYFFKGVLVIKTFFEKNKIFIFWMNRIHISSKSEI
jgi:hypothetical protein